MSLRLIKSIKQHISMEDMLLIGRLIKIKIEEDVEYGTDDITDITIYNKVLLRADMRSCGVIDCDDKFNPFAKNYRNMTDICCDGDAESSRVIITIIEDEVTSKIIYRSEYSDERTDYIFTKMNSTDNIEWYKGFTRCYIGRGSDNDYGVSWNIDSSHIPTEYHVFKIDNDIINAKIIRGDIRFRGIGSVGRLRYHIYDGNNNLKIAASMIKSS